MLPVNPLNLMALFKQTLKTSLKYSQRMNQAWFNYSEYALYGGLEVKEEYSPYSTEAHEAHFSLRRYFPDSVPEGLPALVLVPPLMMMVDLYDVAPRSSSVKAAHDLGIDVWLVDFRRPEAEPDGLSRSLSEYLLAVSDAVDRVHETTGRDVVLGGYSGGGLFSYLVTAYRQQRGVDSVVAFGSPVDFHAAPVPFPVSLDTYAQLVQNMLDLGFPWGLSLPGWGSKLFTQLLDPDKVIEYQIKYFKQLHDRDKILPGEQQRQFLARKGWTHFAAPTFKEFLREIVVANRAYRGGFVIGDTPVTLADLKLPILTIQGELDKEGHPFSVRAIRKAAPKAEIYEVKLPSGHFGIVAGSSARKNSWPRVAEWMRWRAGKGALNKRLVPAERLVYFDGWTRGPVMETLSDTADAQAGLVRALLNTVKELRDALPAKKTEDSAASLGELLDAAAARKSDGVALLFGRHAFRHVELKGQVDTLAARLLSAGMRGGESVGVLMTDRLSAFITIAAISRIGGVAVLLRAQGAPRAEAQLAKISALVTDYHNASAIPPIKGVISYVAGMGHGTSKLPRHVVHLDKMAAPLTPPKFKPSPAGPDDVGFVLFQDKGNTIESRALSNRFFVSASIGVANAAALGAADTLYVTSVLSSDELTLLSLGAALASGARLALARSDELETFWDEVRCYGATHVSCGVALLRRIAAGAPTAAEKHHPIRIFVGSSFPASLWTQVTDRFDPARMLEVFVGAVGGVILSGNPSIKKASLGRPLPGSASVKVAAFDFSTRQLVRLPDGAARECAMGEPGLLLAQAAPDIAPEAALRGVFAPDDVWRSTGHVFLRDENGDFHCVESLDRTVVTVDGPAFPSLAADAFARIPSVEQVVTYGATERGGAKHAVAVLLLHPGAKFGVWDLNTATKQLATPQRPRFVRVIEPRADADHPVLDATALAREGIPAGRGKGTIWRLNADRIAYEQLVPTKRVAVKL